MSSAYVMQTLANGPATGTSSISQIETTPVLPKVRKASEQEQSKPLTYKVGRLLALSLLTTVGRRTPVVKYFIAPVASTYAHCISHVCVKSIHSQLLA